MVPIDNPSRENVVVVAAAIFPQTARPGDAVTLAVRFRTAIGWHVSTVESADQTGPAEPTRLDMKLPAGVSPDGDWVLPQPDTCVDAMGRRRVYTDDVTFRRRLKIDHRQSMGTLVLQCTVSYQACNDTVCTRPVPLELRPTLDVIDRGAEIAGIGAALGNDGEHLVVAKILPDSPAAVSKAINVGDRILAVGDENEPPVDLAGLKLAEAVNLIRGAKGSTVRLTLVPAGKDDSQARVISLVRGELKLKFFAGDLLEPGSKAPNLEMIALPAKTREKLSDYAGKIVVLEFWATWCRPCQDVMAKFQTYPGKYPEWRDKVALIAVSIDDEQDPAIEHLQAKGWDQTHNVWVATDAVKDFHVNGVPTIYIIDPQGNVVDADHGVDIPEMVNRLLQNKK